MSRARLARLRAACGRACVRHAAAAALAPAALALLAAGGCCDDEGVVTLRFWAMGREGEVVQELVRDFEAQHPGIRVEVQQIPWTAAHEKLLTAHVGRATPDVAQLGNTWVPEFTELGALRVLDERVAASAIVDPADHFAGIWETNVLDGRLYGVPWYVDTRVLFYRADLLAAVGHREPPRSWEEWRRALAAYAATGPDRYGILLPVNEWTQPVILGLQAGSPLLCAHDTEPAFSGPDFRQAFAYYVGLFRDGLAPPVSNNEVANLYQEFGRGTFAMYVTGPWNVGEFRRRLPEELQGAWATAPLPGPDATRYPGVSLAGGASLVIFRGCEHPDAAWRLVEFLALPEQQTRFFHLTGDLPAHRAAWRDSALAADPRVQAFYEQLQNVTATPKIPEWEQIATLVWQHAEAAIRGAVSEEAALAALDADVARVLAKRRWMMERRADAAGTARSTGVAAGEGTAYAAADAAVPGAAHVTAHAPARRGP
ncbi:MAG: sugar ABC transporter substrate-binding protein [Candidatus Krumholzibacteriia bacterium]